MEVSRRGKEVWADEAGVWVELDDLEWNYGISIGAARQRRAFKHGWADRHGLAKDADGIGLHIEGACGEIAVAKWKGVYHSPNMNGFKGADLGENIQIRTSTNHTCHLIVRDDDAVDAFYILVTGAAPRFCIRGWIEGEKAKVSEFIKNPGGREAAFFVPIHALHRVPLDPRTRKSDAPI